MASLFVWNDSYSTGIREIDAQHKKLVDILNALYDAMGKGRAISPLANARRAYQYTVVHFATEERLFKLHGYPDALAHKREHDELPQRFPASKGL
jgi:hemerythrin-like metal-binding protein